MTDEEFDCYRQALEHAASEGYTPDAPVSFREEDAPILERATELYEEVCCEGSLA